MALRPECTIVVDVGHATDQSGVDVRRSCSSCDLGGGPVAEPAQLRQQGRGLRARGGHRDPDRRLVCAAGCARPHRRGRVTGSILVFPATAIRVRICFSARGLSSRWRRYPCLPVSRCSSVHRQTVEIPEGDYLAGFDAFLNCLAFAHSPGP